MAFDSCSASSTARVPPHTGEVPTLRPARASFSIPTEAELSDRLNGLERLMTAKRWERAAIVYAFTTNTRRRTDLHPETAFPVTMGRFAQIGFTGLTSKDTVARYRAAWQLAIDQGLAAPTVPGQTDVAWPDMGYPGYPDKVDGMTVTRLKRAIASDPVAARAARELLDEMDTAAAAPSPVGSAAIVPSPVEPESPLAAPTMLQPRTPFDRPSTLHPPLTLHRPLTLQPPSTPKPAAESSQTYQADFDRAMRVMMTALTQMGMIWPYLSDEEQQSGHVRKAMSTGRQRISAFVTRTGYGELRSVQREDAS